MSPLTLTFDNGPTPGITERVLDVLAAHGIKTTFFVIGHKLAASPEARRGTERAHAEGHWIGNHTFTHSKPLGEIADPAQAVAEITRTNAEIGVLAHPDRLFRPYGGGGKIGPWLLSRAALDHVTATGQTIVLWNAVPHDWDDPEGWVERALEQIEAAPRPLLVLHDIEGACLKHLDRFVGLCLDRGVTFHQDFTPDCVPLRRGIIVGDIAPLVSSPDPGRLTPYRAT
jgi:peptidoglycan/xylan/chitin deacetylase (PgdA/CDA1 family)